MLSSLDHSTLRDHDRKVLWNMTCLISKSWSYSKFLPTINPVVSIVGCNYKINLSGWVKRNIPVKELPVIKWFTWRNDLNAFTLKRSWNNCHQPTGQIKVQNLLLLLLFYICACVHFSVQVCMYEDICIHGCECLYLCTYEGVCICIAMCLCVCCMGYVHMYAGLIICVHVCGGQRRLSHVLLCHCPPNLGQSFSLKRLD